MVTDTLLAVKLGSVYVKLVKFGSDITYMILLSFFVSTFYQCHWNVLNCKVVQYFLIYLG